MTAAKVTVTFDDGKTATFNPRRPRLLLDLEKKFKVQAPETHAQMMWMAHHALAPDQEFDDWVDTIDDIEVPEDDEPEDDEGKAEPS